MKFLYLTIISISLAGCSSNSTVETSSNTDITANKNSSIDPTVANANPIVQDESNARSSNVKLRSGGVINKDSFEALKRTKSGDANAAPIQTVPITNAAPDNSEISSAMNNEGIPVETRTFKNNPLLVKTEKILADPKNPTLKVYLKNGKVVSLPASKISDSVNASANEILIAAGAIPKNAPAENVSKEASKKGAN